MSRHYIYTGILALTIVLFSCSGGDSSGDGGDKILPPEATSLISPTKDEECKQGNIVSDTESNVRFEWSKADNATSYTLVIKNLDTNTTEENTTNDVITSIKLLRGVPYSWHVVSKASNTTTTATSETWKFYNAGEGVSNYAPFPAEVVSPNIGATTNTTVSLEWTGSDIDNDIAAYDVYLDTANPPTKLQQANETANKISNISLTANTTYYWRVITKDAAGNTSKSQVFEFKTQ
ncbi:fibronectin type III domain-containing protein [Algibacter sp. 2305UL17-15]|uniref:fibronectin type III domain-containing protein n=1 Tax=Algibacter sp. 2305UL17-15 TaxID=3231268 RepID=UPI00345A3629